MLNEEPGARQAERPFWLAQSTRTIFFFAAVLTVAGIYFAFQAPISVFPETNFPRVVIGVDNGVMPVEQMQVTITKPIEDAVNAVPGLATVRSTTSRGQAEISLFFDWNVDMRQSLQLVDAALSKVEQTLPATARITTNRLTFATFPILGYSLTSDTVAQTELWEIATYDLKPPLNRVAGVSTVTVQGGQTPDDRGNGVALCLAVLDESIDILHFNILAWLPQPGKEQLQVIAIVLGRAGVRSLAPQPFPKRFNFWYHGNAS